MIAIYEVASPPQTIRPAEGSDGPRRCTLCLSWQPANEMVKINSMLVWCSACALRHPEMVPPPADVFWPVGGFLAGALVGCLLGGSQSGTQVAMAADGLIGAIVGIASGIGVWALRTWRAAR